MARDEAPPFSRGETFYNGATIDTNNLGGVQHEGKEWVFEDMDLSSTVTTGAKPYRSNRKVTCRAVRNVAAITLQPKRMVTAVKTAGKIYLGRVDGYTTVTAAPFGGVIDEYLTGGLVVNDVGWVVVEGPTTVLTDLAGGANNVFSVGDQFDALTGATSGSTTSGRVKPLDLTGATAVLGAEILGVVGRALSARTTANTGADLYANIGKW